MARSASWTFGIFGIFGFFISGFLLLPCPSIFTAAHYHELQQHHHRSWYRPRLLPLPPRRAVDLMSDIVNELGVRILQQYLDNGNVAFSPAGVGFIMAALYEGSSSRSRQQIIDSLGMPRDKNAVRVGMGDIHRRLRTYLNPDGFLGGLNLNRENTSLRAEYEDILGLYGFDLSMDLSDFSDNGTGNFGLKGSTTSPTTTPDTEATTATTAPASTISPADAAMQKTEAPGDTTASVEETTSVEAMTSTTTAPDAETSEPTTTTTTTTTQEATTGAALPATTMAAIAALISTTPTLPDLAQATTPAEDIATVAAPPDIPSSARRRRSPSRQRRSSDAYFTTIPDDGLWMQDLDIWADQLPLPETSQDTVELQFLVNGCDLATVSAAAYTAVLPFAYFSSLKAAVLEFPLDNPRYNVMLFLPTERVDTVRLARDLSGHTLRLLRRRLQPTWVQATIPSFMLRGFVTLTPYLQRLGIKDVFEPRLADLSPMTPDLGVYARDVQQSIAVNIRNYMKEDGVGNETESTGNGGSLGARLTLPPRRDDYRFQQPADGLLERIGIVSFTADHPFLFFIVDDETSACLIAGRIDDPLNSRIL